MGLSEKCTHNFPNDRALMSVKTVGGDGVFAWCGLCMKGGPVSTSWSGAVRKFWEQEREAAIEKLTADFLNKLAETIKPECIRSLVKGAEMYVPSDPHEAYKMGVENAARTILEDMPLSGLTDPTDVINAIPSFLRKKLLIRKVTKWTGVILSSWSEKPTILELCDTKEEAEDFLTRNSKPLTKAIPIEIELPL